MGRLIYSAIASLDGYVVDADGSFDWAMPDEEVHAYVNEMSEGIGTHLYGRRMYEVMAFWETTDDDDPVMRDYARVWRSADKVVYSSTLDQVRSTRTRLEPVFDPAAVRRLVDEAATDVSISGPSLAGHALSAGLVDQLDLFVNPVVVGGGTHWLPAGLRLDLALTAEHRFAGGVVHLRYEPRRV